MLHDQFVVDVFASFRLSRSFQVWGSIDESIGRQLRNLDKGPSTQPNLVPISQLRYSTAEFVLKHQTSSSKFQAGPAIGDIVLQPRVVQPLEQPWLCLGRSHFVPHSSQCSSRRLFIHHHAALFRAGH
ncbi:hypothetical protein J3459_018528 [Metarhizium acridum]|uniref:uncharacterized protein n=1 Tax=Metarhizium acridum TaxID=92637 RepID=UPI001C6D1779|nr:hypothetical protein J3459_018528 [Metarhizium acridum]KAG8423708.1 hypothetical protein J3458_000579 [Metarhizium acridum]